MPDLFRIGALMPTDDGYTGSLNIGGTIFSVRVYPSFGRYVIETEWNVIGDLRKDAGWSGKLSIFSGLGMPLAVMEASDRTLIVFWKYEAEVEPVEKPYYMQKQKRKPRKQKEGNK
jgi:hypothetical protein